MYSPDPRFDKPTVCSHCDVAPATEGPLCAECSIALHVDNDECDTAHEIAERHGLSREYVEGVIREAAEYARTIRREMHDAMRAA